ncbi:MAG: DUF354 domain-containing protein [Candidatus Hermodarchaeota archaeon]
MKIWIDACEPKTVIMLKPLYERLKQNHNVYFTSRDFDSTIYLLDKYNIPHYKAGKHGGGSKLGKLKAYAKRLNQLIKITVKEKPDFLFSLASPEALRISFGLGISNIIFNDEPRSRGVVSLTLSLADKIIVPKCIPHEWYSKYISDENKLIRFNGIDEVGWLSDFKPNESILERFNLQKNDYIVCRTEASKAQYLSKKMKPHQTLLTKIIPELIEHKKDIKYIIITRYREQYNYLKRFFKEYIKRDIVRIYEALDQLSQIMYFSKMVITGGGTMVRESALLGVPSIEYFPLDTYPQEQFLIDNGFPLKHIRELNEIIKQSLVFIEGNYKFNTNEKIKLLENPINIALINFQEGVFI